MKKCFTKMKSSVYIIFLVFLILGRTYANEKDFSWDFSDCEIKDILFAISMETGISIVPDDTVNGTGDFQFSGGDFNNAFESFLRKSRLYVTKDKNVWTVSKFKFQNFDGKYSLDAYDLYPYQLIEKISERVEWIITYDNLPNLKMSVHFKNLTKEQLIMSLCKYLGQYEVSSIANGFHFQKIKTIGDFENYDSNIEITVDESEKSYCINIKDCSFFDVIERLFAVGKNYGKNLNYSILSSGNSNVTRAFFIEDNFESALNKICSQNGYKAVLIDDIFYITADSGAKTKLVEGEKKWIKYSLSYISTDELIPLLNKKISNLEVISLLDKASFLCNCSDNEDFLIKEFITEIDIKRTVKLINLKYLRPDELMDFLPPTIDKNSLYLADNSSQLYFRGTEDSYKNILEQINVIDKPVKRISYDLLILQSDENSQNSWSSSIGAKSLKMGKKSNSAVMLGSVMGFNLNVVGAFGIDFAADLQASIEENSTRVYADTTLHGVSGKKISFQNTNTYRYRDNNVNPENGKPIYSGITKEIVTGIKIDVLGWISGDGMITSTVTASISRQGIDNSEATGNPPPTSEKLLTTEVTGKSGEPIVLSGLLLSAESEGEKRSPFISKIPLIGNLFKNKNKTKENSQMIIYLVPHVEEDVNISDKNENYTEEWVEEKITKIINMIKEES